MSKKVPKLLQIYFHDGEETKSEKHGDPQLRVGAPSIDQLSKLPPGEGLNLIMICGRAREGKSFLMNMLAGRDGLFRVSPSNVPCTVGTDMSPHFDSASDFAGAPVKGLVGFLDTEGQGDRGAAFDVQLGAPSLLLSKVVILNWKGRPAKDEMLQKLAVLAEAASRIRLDSSEEEGEEEGKEGQYAVFGHLHIILRDCPDIEGVGDLILHQEPGRATDKGRTERNRIREVLQESFESISIWGLPSPITDAMALDEGKFTEADCSEAFTQAVGRLKAKVAEQIKVMSISVIYCLICG
jgi:hypothetical protein